MVWRVCSKWVLFTLAQVLGCGNVFIRHRSYTIHGPLFIIVIIVMLVLTRVQQMSVLLTLTSGLECVVFQLEYVSIFFLFLVFCTEATEQCTGLSLPRPSDWWIHSVKLGHKTLELMPISRERSEARLWLEVLNRVTSPPPPPPPPHSSGAVWESRWTSWAVRPNEPSGFHGRKDLLHRASALVTTCP